MLTRYDPVFEDIVFDDPQWVKDFIAANTGGAGATPRPQEAQSTTTLRHMWRLHRLTDAEYEAELSARGMTAEAIAREKTVGISTAASTRGQLTGSEQAGMNAIRDLPAATATPAPSAPVAAANALASATAGGTAGGTAEPQGGFGATLANATAAGVAGQTSGETTTSPSGRSFEQITGTEYLSDDERAWYLAEARWRGGAGGGLQTVAHQVQSGARSAQDEYNAKLAADLKRAASGAHPTLAQDPETGEFFRLPNEVDTFLMGLGLVPPGTVGMQQLPTGPRQFSAVAEPGSGGPGVGVSMDELAKLQAERERVLPQRVQGMMAMADAQKRNMEQSGQAVDTNPADIFRDEYAARGYRGVTTQPTRFHTSETGQPEMVTVQPLDSGSVAQAPQPSEEIAIDDYARGLGDYARGMGAGRVQSYVKSVDEVRKKAAREFLEMMRQKALAESIYLQGAEASRGMAQLGALGGIPSESAQRGTPGFGPWFGRMGGTSGSALPPDRPPAPQPAGQRSFQELMESMFLSQRGGRRAPARPSGMGSW